MSGLDLTNYDSSALRGSYAWTDTLRGVHYGPGSLSTALPKLLALLGAKRALIVTGKSLREKTDVVSRVESVLAQHNAHAGTFSSISEHAPIAGILAGASLFLSSHADIIVSVGGGSPIDASKAILHTVRERTGAKDLLKQVAVPTTLSAAEYTTGAGYTDEGGQKVALADPALAPAGVILDAELTLATPERLWLSTGMRAVDHAVENLYRPLVPPPVKVLCYGALADLFKYLPESKARPDDLVVRQKLQIASWQSLWPLKLEKYSALGLSHALGHKLGAAYSIPHGITSCLTLAPVVALKADTASPEDKESLAEALFYLRQPSTGSVDGDIRKLSTLIHELVDGLGLKSTLTQYKVPKDDVPKIAAKSVGGEDQPDYAKVVKLLENLY